MSAVRLSDRQDAAPLAPAASLAAWLEREGITTADSSGEVAVRLADALGEARLAAWLGDGTGTPELRAAATGIADLHRLGDAGWAAENYRHGHEEEG